MVPMEPTGGPLRHEPRSWRRLASSPVRRVVGLAAAVALLAACGEAGGNGPSDARTERAGAEPTTSTAGPATGASGPTGPSGATGVPGGTPPSTTATSSRPTGCPVGTTTAVYRTLPAVPARLTSLDVHNPSGGCGLPVWVWVHGGGYATGDKANKMEDKIRLAAEQGWLLVSVNYRLSVPGDPASARFPDHYADVAAAIAWIRNRITPFGGDPERIALFGHSAGADIVSNVAVVPDYLAAYGLTPNVIDCVGPLDTAGFDKPAALAGATVAAEREEAMWDAALGNNPDYPVATSARLRIDASRRVPPMVLAPRGGPERRAIAEGLASAVRATGAEVTTIEAGGLTHNEVNSRIGAPGDAVMTAPIVDFLDRCFAR